MTDETANPHPESAPPSESTESLKPSMAPEPVIPAVPPRRVAGEEVRAAPVPYPPQAAPYAVPVSPDAYPPLATPAPAVQPDHVPFARLVLPVGTAALLGVFVVAMSATVGVVAALVVDGSWPDWLSGLTYFTLITLSYAIQMLVVYVLARRRGLRFAPAVGLNPFPVAAGIAAAVVVSFAGRFLAGFAAVLLQALGIRLPQPTTDPTSILGRGPVSVVLVLVLLMVVAPFAEEVIFRGVIMGSLHRRYGPRWAILGSGLLFALVHVQPATVFAIVFVGLAFGWVAMRYRSIWPSIIAHSLFNGVSAAAIYWLRSIGRL